MTPPNPPRSSFTIYATPSPGKWQYLDVHQDGQRVKRFRYQRSDWAAWRRAGDKAQAFIDSLAPRTAKTLPL